MDPCGKRRGAAYLYNKKKTRGRGIFVGKARNIT